MCCKTTEFDYGFDGVRFKRTDTSASSTKQTLYIGNVEFTTTNGIISLVQRHLAGVAVELEYYGSNSRVELNYLYRDHLGSITVMTDAIGRVIQESSFDVWGQRRALDAGNDNPLKPLNRALSYAHADYNRGFTGHEHIDELGIIHMNGRVYDPRLARFLSVDPIVADGTNLQSYNRYSYVGNNPLNAVDPSGYSAAMIIPMIIGVLVGAEVVADIVAIAYYIYVAYQAVEAIYNSVQAFKYGNGGVGAVISAVMAVYSAVGAVQGISKASSSSKGAGAEGNKESITYERKALGSSRPTNLVSDIEAQATMAELDNMAEKLFGASENLAARGGAGEAGLALGEAAYDMYKNPSRWKLKRVYDDSTYNKHGKSDKGEVSRAPKNGQKALDNSIQIKGTSPRRVGVDLENGEVVILDRQEVIGKTEKFHGHIQNTITEQKIRNTAAKLRNVIINKQGKWKVKRR